MDKEALLKKKPLWRRFFSRLFTLGLLTALPFCCVALERSPWYGRNLEPRLHLVYCLQQYDEIQTDHGSYKRTALDHFVFLGADFVYDVWSLELDVILADTKSHSFSGDSFSLTGRYQILDDVVGDCVSMVAGATLRQVFKEGLTDIGSFHHGMFETELSLAIGKETESGQFWRDRSWIFLSCGQGDRGLPWIRALLTWEYNQWDWWQFSIFLHGLLGFGDEELVIHHFDGYGSVKHRSVNLGALYRYQTCYGWVGAEYQRRLLARNFPKNVNIFQISLDWPIDIF